LTPLLKNLLSRKWVVVHQIDGPPDEIYQPEMVATEDGEHVICRLAQFDQQTREELAELISRLPSLIYAEEKR
jgi:hypothetical protein